MQSPSFHSLVSISKVYAVLLYICCANKWEKITQCFTTHFLRHRGQSSLEPSSVHFRIQCRWKWWRHWPWIGTQSSPGTLHRGQGASKANWQMVQHSSLSMSHFQVATAFQALIFTFIQIIITKIKSRLSTLYLRAHCSTPYFPHSTCLRLRLPRENLVQVATIYAYGQVDSDVLTYPICCIDDLVLSIVDLNESFSTLWL